MLQAPQLANPGAQPFPTEPRPAPAAAPSDQYANKDDLVGLRTDLENFKFQWQHERDLHTGISVRGLAIDGTIQGRVGYESYPVNTTTGGVVMNNRQVTFDTGAVVLAFAGSLYKDYEEGRNLTYLLRFGASPQQATNNNFLNLLDAQVTYSPVPTVDPAAPALKFTLGEQLLPFGIEVPAPEDLKPVIINAQFTTNLNLARRDVGLLLQGDLFPVVDYGYNYRVAILQYALGVFNGAGPNTPDDNTAKDVIARIAFSPPSDYNSWLRVLTVGATAYVGWQNLFLAVPPGSTTTQGALEGVGKKHRFGADLNYQHFPWGLTYEFIYSMDDVATGTTLANPTRVEHDGISHVGTLFYSFGEQFLRDLNQTGRLDDWWPKTGQPFFRIDTYQPNVHVQNNRSTIYTLGFNAFFAETTKVQLNYNIKNFQPLAVGAASAGPGIQHEVYLQIQYGF